MGTRARRLLIGIAAIVAVLFTVVIVDARARFVAGGAMVNAGYELQDGLHAFDLHGHDDPRPEEVWKELVAQNHMAASVRKKFPRSAPHPLVAMVTCMDSRVDTVEVAGDTRKYYYVLRSAGSVVGPEEEDMLELAVANGVKVIVLTTHSDCAAEKMAKDPERRKMYPHLAAAIDERERRVDELLARPTIAAKIASGDLLVKRVHIDTATDGVIP